LLTGCSFPKDKKIILWSIDSSDVYARSAPLWEYCSRHRVKISITLPEVALLIFLWSGVENSMAWLGTELTSLDLRFSYRCPQPLSQGGPLQATNNHLSPTFIGPNNLNNPISKYPINFELLRSSQSTSESIPKCLLIRDVAKLGWYKS